MNKRQDKRITVVTGDITIDWNIARIQQSVGAIYAWNATDLTCAFYQPGGAAMLARLMEAVSNELRQSKQDYFGVRKAEIPEGPVNPNNGRVHHSYALWSPFRLDERDPANKRRVWRVQEFMGLNRASTDMASQADWEKVVDDATDADLVILDDATLGFCDHREYWPQAIVTNKSKPWVLLKMAWPVAQGQLWDHLRRNHADRLVALMTVDDLRRHADVHISRQISWERTAQDLVWELLYNSHINVLAQCLHVVVSLGTAGAVLLSRKASDTLEAFLLFDPRVMEGEWGRNYKGYMIGYTTCLAAGIARELILNTSDPNMPKGIQSGIHAMRSLQIEGYGDAGTDLSKHPVAFPVSKIAAELAADSGHLAVVQIKNPAQAQSRQVTTVATAVTHPFWTILEDQNPGSLEEVAQQLVREGLEHALPEVPARRFGGLVTVDRKEIEALNSISGLIGEYCQRPSKRPLSIAVFGPPGSGKSFAIKQIANSVLPGEIKDLTFNLSQFGGPADLLDAFHQVRDKALTGKLPLIFWDEFDTSLQDQPLGWLRYFLAPMQDGEFQEGQLVHPIGKSIFVFAGGTSNSIEAFGVNLDEEKRRAVKLPDFISRIKGFLNVLGPNPQISGKSLDSMDDPYYIIRRAILLRSIFERNAPQLFVNDAGRRILNIDGGLLRAFLLINEYRHGARSMETIIATSQLARKASFERSSLPTEAQLDLHVDGRGFYALMYRLTPDKALLEKLAEAAHQVFCESLEAKGYTYGPETKEDMKVHSSLKAYSELPENEKEQNRNNVRDIPNKLAIAGYAMLAKRGSQRPGKFTDDAIEKLAKMEHERWMQQKLNSGWEYAKRTNKDKRLHKDLIPWHDLSHDEQDKDRDLIKGIPGIIEKAGYTMVKLGHVDAREGD